jgi:pimeloyl-ACP methyl ester carboxylesterase
MGLLLASACSSDGETRRPGAGGSGGSTADGGGSGGTGSGDECSVVVSDADCDDSLRPFVFVHGTYGSGDNIAHVASLFGSNGYCQDRFVTIEYNSVSAPTDPAASPIEPLDALVDDILARTGADQVELAGHSQGTRWATEYLAKPERAAKVAHYINYSGTTPVPNDVKTLSLSSENDIDQKVRHSPGSDVKEVTFKDEDHFAVASSTHAFIETWKFLYGKDPKYTEIQCGDEEVTIEGISEAFADNAPLAGKAEIYELPDEPRGKPKNAITSAADAKGHFGPIKLKRNVAYELKGYDAAGELIGYQYFTPFKRSNRLVRLLVPSGNQLVAGATSDNFKRTEKQMAIVVRYAPGAFRQDLGDELLIDGKQVLTPDNAGKTQMVVGLFVYDANENSATDLGASFSAPFVVGTDVFIDATTPRYVEFEFKGQKAKVANWPARDALNILMFQ